MTLVLLIPYNQGCLLIADRQETFPDGSKIEFTKLYCHGDNGPALGCAGGADLIRKLYSELRGQDFSTQDSFTIIKKKLDQSIKEASKNATLMGPGLDPYRLGIDFLLVELQNKNMVASLFNRLWIRKIDRNKICAIPEENIAVRQYLIDTTSFSEKDAIGFGAKILRQVSFNNVTVGPPEYHGYDMIKVTNSGKFSFVNEPATFQRLTVNELLNEMNPIE